MYVTYVKGINKLASIHNNVLHDMQCLCFILLTIRTKTFKGSISLFLTISMVTHFSPLNYW